MKKLINKKSVKFIAGLSFMSFMALKPVHNSLNHHWPKAIYAAQVGLVKNGTDMYYYSSTGEKLTGLQTIEGRKYYFSKTTGKALSGLRVVNGERYYFSKVSKKSLGGLIEVDGSKYYFSTVSYKSLSGLRTVKGNKYYFSKTTGKALSGFREYNGKIYYLSSDTKTAQRGFVTINNKKYYFDENTYEMVFGTKIINGQTYTFDSKTGVLIEQKEEDKSQVESDKPQSSKPQEQTTGIIYKNNEPYQYIDEKGNVKTGMITVNNEKYYFQYGGGVYKGLKTVSNKLYYFTNDNGKAAKGITQVGNDSYYFHPTSSYAVSGLHSIFEKTYYFDTNTYKMMKNDTVQIGYLSFTADKNGLVTNVKAKSGYENNKRANALLKGMELIGTPYGSGDNELMCNRFAATVMLAAGNNELVTYSDYNKKMYYKPVEVQAQYVLEKGYNKNVTFENLKPGDLIFWDYGVNGPSNKTFTFNGKKYCIGHVSVYLGNNTMIEATGSTWDKGTGHVRVTTFDPSTAKPTYYPAIYASLLP